MTNGSHTEDLKEKIHCTLEYFISKDQEAEETEHHRCIRTLIEEPMERKDDKDFTTEEIRQTIEIRGQE
jgi:hypothetical protein